MSFQRACALSDLTDSAPVRVEVDGLDVALVRHDNEVFAIEDECSHAAVALSEGDVDDCTIECWMHGSRFDLRTGKPSGPPADVLTGFLSPEGDAYGRPVGVAVDGKGGLLVADDAGNQVWRVTAASPGS